MARQSAPESQTPESPATDAPATEVPAADAAATGSPAGDSPSTAAPSPKELVTEKLVTEEIAAGEEAPAAARRRLPLLLGGAAVVLAAFAVVAGIQAHSLRQQRGNDNVALTNAAGTSQVRRQVTSAINTIFSYNYADTATTRAAAQRLLTGPAVRQYDSLFKLVQQQAPAQHLVLTTKVTSAGVEFLVGDRARLLIFANQRDTRMTTKQTSYAGAMFAVNAVHVGSRWEIDSIDTFTGGS